VFDRRPAAAKGCRLADRDQPVRGRSRYRDKPALFVVRREIAQLEADGVIDLRIPRGGLA
jgi:hypothetical protein